MRQSPCDACEKRNSTCHADCPDYTKWREEKEKEDESRKKAKKKRDIVADYTIDTMLKTKRKSNKRKKGL